MNTKPINGRSQNFVKAVKTIGIAKNIRGYITIAIFAAILVPGSLWLMHATGLPKVIGYGLIGLPIVMAILQTIALIRALRVKVTPDHLGHEASSLLEEGEAVMGAAAGILRWGQGASSYAVLGTGKNLAPENALIVTSRAIWAVTLPIEGAGIVASKTNIGEWQWLIMKQELEDLMHELLQKPFSELLSSCVSVLRIDKQDIVSVRPLDISYAVRIRTRDGKKYNYSMRMKEDYERIKELLIG